mmetsp:Transcript_3010/g.12454  ORF Transcript_3010/g.12454 Transcript_3010/m.12454 type:complete len:294 (-) Transcript_3010:699-1580(-)
MFIPHLLTYLSSISSARVTPLVAMSISPSTKFSSLAPRLVRPSFAMRTISIATSCTVPSRNGVCSASLVTAVRRYSRSSGVQSLTSASASSSAFESYSRPTHSAGNAQMFPHGPPSPPRISMYRFRRTSGNAVVRCCSQSSSVGVWPSNPGSVPAMKSRKLWPVTSWYSPFRYTKYIGTSRMYSAYFSNPKSSSNTHASVPVRAASVSSHTRERRLLNPLGLPSQKGELAKSAVATGCSASDVRNLRIMSRSSEKSRFTWIVHVRNIMSNPFVPTVGMYAFITRYRPLGITGV